jgi:mycoredoxin-dependent peroxiredoxin
MPIEIGHEAPDFELKNQHGESVSLRSYRGSHRVVLVFFPYAFSRVCSGEMHALSSQLPDFANSNTQLIAVSCDHMFSLRAFADQDRLGFPILSDFWPHGAVSKSYGVFDPGHGCADRGTFIIDSTGVLRWSVHHEMSDARSVEDYKAVLAGL